MNAPTPIAIGGGRHDREAQQRRRDRLEVEGIGEEREDRVGMGVDDLLAAQRVNGHHHGGYG